MKAIIIFAITIILLVGIGILVLVSPPEDTIEGPEKTAIPPAPDDSENELPDVPTEVDTLLIEDIRVGSGEEALVGSIVMVNYVGTLTDGTEFDSSYKRGTPFQFVLGAGRVIQGWDQGVLGMKVGGKRKLTIPPDLAYGDLGAGEMIPPNATLIFEVELLEVSE